MLLLESKNKEKNQTTKTGSRIVVTRGHGSGESGEILDKWYKVAVMLDEYVLNIK